jgi:hypothetical protein
MATDKKALSIYVSQDLADLIASNAIADGRTVSNYVERLLERSVPTTVRAVPAHEIVRKKVSTGQVDLETAIAEAAIRGPVNKAARKK